MQSTTLRRLALCTLLLPAAASLASAQEIVGRKESVFTLNERVSAGGWVRLFSHAGDITITEGSGGTVELRAEKDPRRGSVEDMGFVILRQSDGLTICAVYAGYEDNCEEDGLRGDRRRGSSSDWRNRGRVHMTVRVPRGVRVRSGTGNGDLSLVAAVAEARVSSGNGKVRVSGVEGRVEASSGNGEVTIEGAGGPVRANSGNGDVFVSTANGPVNASSGNGDLRITMRRLTGSDDLEFSTGNGRVLLDVPADFSAEVEASTGNGRVTTDFPITIQGRVTPTRLRGTIGNGGRRLRMSSGNGSLEIRKAGDGGDDDR